MHKSIKRNFWIVFMALFVGCGTFSPQQASHPTATSAPTLMPIPQTPTALVTETLALTPSPTPLPLFPLDGYVMTFVKDGDLYFQDGNNLPVKLTHVGKISKSYAVSDDHQKVVFPLSDGNVYSINADGTQEKTVIENITNDWPPSPLQPGINRGIMGFVPGTHQLLFETALCESQKYESPCSTSLFIANTDTGVIKKLADFGLSLQQDSINRNFGVSPDGKMVAVGTINGVDLLTLDGRITRHNILPYKPSTSTVLFPSLFWLPDSSGLIVALPNTFYNSSAWNNYPASTIWRYMIDSKAAVQIPFDPAPMGWNFQVSPDGKWIAYGGLANDEWVYLGNLTDGHIQSYGAAYTFRFLWGSDSRHFIATNAESFLGAIDNPTLTPICQLSGKWVDAGHFICSNPEQDGLRLRMAEIGVEGLKIYDLGFGKDVEDSLFIKPK